MKISPSTLMLLTPALSSFSEEREDAGATFASRAFYARIVWGILTASPSPTSRREKNCSSVGRRNAGRTVHIAAAEDGHCPVDEREFGFSDHKYVGFGLFFLRTKHRLQRGYPM